MAFTPTFHVCFPQLGAVALYYTYTALEEEIERNKDHPYFAPLYFPAELHRHEALARDLEYFYGPEWKSHASCSKATQQYVDRIHQVGQEDPVLLVAHAYTRYMGDLSGGQVLKKVAQRALKLPPTGEGLEFYQFDAIHSAKAFKQLYRSRMNELELDMETKKRLVDEAVKAFLFNIEVRGQAEDEVVFHFVEFSDRSLKPQLLNKCVSSSPVYTQTHSSTVGGGRARFFCFSSVVNRGSSHQPYEFCFFQVFELLIDVSSICVIQQQIVDFIFQPHMLHVRSGRCLRS